MLAADETWDSLKSGADMLGNATKAVGYIDSIVDIVGHFITDYSTQVHYLDLLEDTILSFGYNSTGVLTKSFETLRRQYTDSVYYAATKVGEKIKSEVSKAIIKQIPVVGDIYSGIGTVSTVAKALWGSDISATNTLLGMQMYDSVLTKSYERYTGLMEAGVASNSDMKAMDELFLLLGGTKKKEYECMLELCKKGSDEYNKFADKLSQINEWLKKANSK